MQKNKKQKQKNITSAFIDKNIFAESQYYSPFKKQNYCIKGHFLFLFIFFIKGFLGNDNTRLLQIST